VVNTRALDQAAEFDGALRGRGAEPVSFPCVAIAPCEDERSLRAGQARLQAGGYDWLIFTSANAVRAFAGDQAGKIPGNVRIGAVGPGTVASLRATFNRPPDLVPPDHHAAGLLAAIEMTTGERVLLPSSSLARTELADGLRARGAEVDVVVAYRTVVGSGGVDLAPMIASGAIDAIAFASPSAVDGFVSRLKAETMILDQARALPIGCIGRTTAARAAELAFTSISIAQRQTIDGLVDSLAEALARSREGAKA
jgi:uroporphyrinogen-III synthase